MFPLLPIIGITASSIIANQLSQRQAQSFSAKQAQISRDWQEKMSNTQYQRTVRDMEAAGLNPALLMSGSSAVSTPGAYVPNSNAINFSNLGASVLNSALNAIFNEKDIQFKLANEIKNSALSAFSINNNGGFKEL